MAIDTAAKRKSCIGIGLIFLRTGVIPTGSDLNAPERLHVQGLYAGIAASLPETGVMGGAGRIVYVRQKKKKDYRHPIDRMLDSVVREMYEAVTGENVPPEVREEAASEVRAFVKPSIPRAKIPTAPAIDWVALAGDMARVERLLALWQIQLEKIREDEDDEDMLLLMGW